MIVKATRPIIDWDAEAGRSVVINKGETGILSDSLASIHEGSWEPAEDLPQLDHDGDGAPGGSVPDDPPALTGKNKAELLDIAKAEGAVADADMTNKDIIAAIEAVRVSGDIDDAPPA